MLTHHIYKYNNWWHITQNIYRFCIDIYTHQLTKIFQVSQVMQPAAPLIFLKLCSENKWCRFLTGWWPFMLINQQCQLSSTKRNWMWTSRQFDIMRNIECLLKPNVWELLAQNCLLSKYVSWCLLNMNHEREQVCVCACVWNCWLNMLFAAKSSQPSHRL